MTTKKLLIDCDPGHDDVVAILLAAGDPRAELLGLTTVGGNQTLERVTRNACIAATVAGIDVPVVPGCRGPLLRKLNTAAEYHGESGLVGAAPVEPKVVPRDGHGVDFMAATILQHPGEVTLVATGPLTNVAMAVRHYPEIVSAVSEVTLMGGSWTRGNTTPAAEFNIWVDPEAASIVFGAPWKVTMIGLDVTHQALYTPEVDRRISSIDTDAARWVSGVLRAFGEQYLKAAGMPAPPVHDPCAVGVALDPEPYKLRPARVDVETVGRYTSGMTVVDFDAAAEQGQHLVGTGLEAATFWDTVAAALANLE